MHETIANALCRIEDICDNAPTNDENNTDGAEATVKLLVAIDQIWEILKQKEVLEFTQKYHTQY